MSNVGRRKGFSLIEALVAVTLVAVGVASAVQGIGSLNRANSILSRKQKLVNLAIQKLDEMQATGETSEQGGTFEDEGVTGVTWELRVETTGVTNLNELIVTVTQGTGTNAPTATVSGLAATDTGASTGTEAAQ